MTEFTPEQEAEIQKRIDEARKQQSEMEQYRISGDQFFRESLANMDMKVRQGVYDPFVLNVGKTQYNAFLSQFFPQAPAPDQPPEGAVDDPTKQD